MRSGFYSRNGKMVSYFLKSINIIHHVKILTEREASGWGGEEEEIKRCAIYVY